ncbi:MAG: hydantoinase/oxoprolinase family protein [Burkholderiales bacterium]|nr:hydantoinase/oxoprolinase family protein [Burkholderiales bacterium]
MTYRVGVDIGGSFTDFAVFDERTKAIKTMKVFSRPDAPGAEVLAGVQAIGERYGVPASEITYFTHGTTVGLNAVIQRKGLKLALLVTEHFRDVLELGRLKTPDMYGLLSKRPEPLIPREMVFGIPGRLNADGSELQPVDENAVAAMLGQARAKGAEGIVISLLHAYANPAHELQVKALIERLAPGLPVSCSSETWPIIREYERTVTAVIGGYVQPRVAHYLSALQSALRDAGVPAQAHLTKSNGGVMTAEQGKSECVQMLLSGTASGVIGASYVAEVSGLPRCMSLDIGGTSADVAIIVDGKPQYGVGERIGDFQIYIPSVSVTSIGEGGGSIAWVDPLGVLKVGPDSAGSYPGPACFGRGGELATITDAFVACGLIGHAELGHKAVNVDVEKARTAVSKLAVQLNRSIEETAENIIQVAVSGMYTEVSALVSRFGVDPREFSMLAFGGAGPMMGCFLARELHMEETLVPPTPGVLSALGGLIADLKSDFIKTLYLTLDEAAVRRMAEEFTQLRARALRWLKDEQQHTGEYRITHTAEIRYAGQSFEIETPLDGVAEGTVSMAAVADAFHAEHERIYGHADRKAALQVISLRVVISGITVKPELARHALAPGVACPSGHITGRIDGAMREVALYRRTELRPGQTFNGPAVVMQDDCTTVVPTGFAVEVDEYANLRIRMDAAR